MATRKTGFASDFDGTLCTSNWVTGEVSFKEENLAAIRAYQAAGGLFGVCTGRPLSSVLETLEGILDLDFYIVMTGSQVLDRDLNKLWECTISHDTARELYDRYATDESVMLAVTEDEFVSVANHMNDTLPTVTSIDDVRGGLLGVSFECYEDQTAARALCDDINERFVGVVEGFQNLGSVDVVPAGCSKGSGVRIVRERLGLDAVAGAGDSFNDLTLLRAADVSYTFASSPRVVRDAADVVVDELHEALADFRFR